MANLISVLLIEDNLKDSELLIFTLKEAGIDFSYKRIDNKEAYLEALKTPPDIIISDHSLPQFDGITALEILKQHALDIPFILVSGAIGEALAVNIMRLGAKDYIMKHNLSRLPSVFKRELLEAQMRRHLKETENDYQNLVELSPDAIFKHCEGKIVYANKAAFTLFDTDNLTDQSVSNFIPSDWHGKIITAKGKKIEVEMRSVSCVFKDKAAVQVYARNVSERTKAERKIKAQNKKLIRIIQKNKKLKYADVMKTAFLAMTSHELRTPLNAIIGFSEVLKDGLLGVLSPKQREYCADIHKSGLHLLALINDILDLSKVEAGKMELELERVDLLEALKDSINVVKENASSHGVHLALNINENLGFSNFDLRKLKQILYNLLSNAIKFSPSGGVVTLSASIKNSNTLEIVVSDMGKGISEENIKKLFKPFEQVHKSSQTQEKGTGLGLMIAKRLVELHSGNILVESTLGKGTKFIIEFPIGEKIKEKTIPKNAYVLVVEDDPKSAELIGVQLKELGFDMLWKNSSEAALNEKYDTAPDLIILDILLPGMSGLELLPIIKSNKKLKNVPFVVISVVAEEKKGMIIGAVDVLQKPISRHELSHVIKKCIKENNLKENFDILVTDDDPQAIAFVKHALNELSCKITCAYNGEETLSQVKKKRPDIIILDLMMPKMNGFEVIEHLKKNKNTSGIPIIVLSSKILTQEDLDLFRANSINVLRKDGLKLERFKQEIKRILLR